MTTATGRPLTPAQTSAEQVAAARQAKTAITAFTSCSARAPGAGLPERASALGWLQLGTQELASCISYSGYAVRNTWQGHLIPATDPAWIGQATHAAAQAVQDGANLLQDYRDLPRAGARPVLLISRARAIATSSEVLYDLLVRQSGMYRVRPGDAPDLLGLLAGCCEALAAALAAEAKHGQAVLGGDPAGALRHASRQATQGWAQLGAVVRAVRADVRALPAAQRRPGKRRGQ